jgi:NAD-dependent dihydropyrimidine dehydrogenase PreA subunit
VRWLFRRAGWLPPSAAEEPTFYNLREQTVDSIVAALRNGAPVEENGQVAVSPSESDWIPWYPLIDYDRCSGCQQCASFCLFNVYEIGPGGKVEVSNPRNCKTNCPACARICPQAAIMFPKLEEAPLNGAEVMPEHERQDTIRLDLDEVMGTDVYAALVARRQRVKRILLRKKAMGRAIQERSLCADGQATAAEVAGAHAPEKARRPLN